MARIDIVYQKLKNLSEKDILLFGSEAKGVTSNEISDELGLDRANVSKDLNKLTSARKAVKIKSRPVLFLDVEVLEYYFPNKITKNHFESLNDFFETFFSTSVTIENTFSDLVGFNSSLKDAIKKAEASILYPPKGLTTLITGETGVGKTLFVESMYEYAKSKSILESSAPFVVFNCADYADNQQLLLSHLFGHKKGSFTGAIEDSVGLVNFADGGILFLDEVHRLSSKGQEMLFYLMDKGTYKKLGEVDSNIQANIRIIMATTEDPTKVMLDTFLRRIPVHIHLPPLRQKMWEEKLSLIQVFVDNECKKINRQIRINKDVLKILLNHQFDGNIGQLKSDLQFICANAFVDSISDKRGEVQVKINNLPNEMLQDLDGLENRNKEIYSLPESLMFVPDKKLNRTFSHEFDYGNYERVRDSLILMEESKDNQELEKPLENAITQYTSSVLKIIEENDNKVKSIFLDDEIYHIVRKSLLGFVESKEIEIISNIITHHIMLVLSNASHESSNIKIEPISEIEELVIIETIVNKINKGLKQIKKTNLSYIDLKIIEYLLSNLIKKESVPHVGILVVMHGASTASSMAETVNQLLSTDQVQSIDMDLESKVSDIFEKTKMKVKEMNSGLGVLLLADMGSIKSFENKIIKELSTEIKVIDMVSTPIVLEAARLSLSRKLNLTELADSLYKILYRHWQTATRSSSETDFRYFENMIIEKLKRILVFLDSDKIFVLFKSVLREITIELNLDLTDEFLLKFIFHNGCMIEKILINNFVNSIVKHNEQKSVLVDVIREKYIIVEEYFGIQIPNNELECIVDMFMYEFPDKLLVSNPQFE